MNNKKIKRVGRSGQTWIYLGKLFRMFIYQNDWKVLPMVVYGPDEITLYRISAENKTNKPVGVIVDYVESEPGMKEDLMLKCGEQNYNEKYESSNVNIIGCWICLIVMIIFFHIAAVISLEFIDRDRR